MLYCWVFLFDSNVVGLRVSRRERNNQNILLAQGFYRYDSDGVMFKPHCQLGSWWYVSRDLVLDFCLLLKLSEHSTSKWAVKWWRTVLSLSPSLAFCLHPLFWWRGAGVIHSDAQRAVKSCQTPPVGCIDVFFISALNDTNGIWWRCLTLFW